MFHSLDIYIFMFWNPQISKSVTLHLCLPLLNLSTIKMKLDKILVCSMTNISKSISFMILWKWQYSEIWPFFNIRHLSFFIVPYLPFHKNETLGFTWHNWLLTLLSNWSRVLNWKGPWTQPQSSKLFKRILKIIALAYIYQLTNFGDLTFIFCVLTLYLLINGE